MNSKAKRLREAGFTLLEVVVAMTIVGLGVVTLLQIFSLGLRLGTRSTASTQAISYAREVMDDFLSRPNLDEGSEQGITGGNARWKILVRTVRDPARTLTLGADVELREIDLEMLVPEGRRNRRIELKTFRLVRKKV
jgi:general secretion pathway protein I